jgi:HPt (histidine-containing phosphotransfer) domain-containing protein
MDATRESTRQPDSENGECAMPDHNHANAAVEHDRHDPIHVERALARMGGDRELFREVLDAFRQTCPGLLAELHAALETSDSRRVGAVAHTIKGAAASIGAEATSELALKLETMGKRGDLAEAAATIAALEEHCRQVDAFAQASLFGNAGE